MTLPFREKAPVRTYNGTYTNYRSYKPHLREDFNKRCGYTDCTDFWFGGKGTFHIDHFKPHSKYPTLKEAYSNLVYACSYVNILKSDDDGNYLDPCDEDFNNHFERGLDGSIIPKSASTNANFMFKKLKLYLNRYRIIWMLEQLTEQMSKLKSAIESTQDATLKKDLLAVQGELGNLLIEYIHYLKAEQ